MDTNYSDNKHFYDGSNLMVANHSATMTWVTAAAFLESHGVEVSSRNFQNPDKPKKTKELMHVMMAVSDPKDRLVLARPINPAFAIAEVIWILSGANDLEFLEFWNPRMRSAGWASDGKSFHGAYGARLGCNPCDTVNTYDHRPQGEFDQLYAAYVALEANPDTRQMVMQIYDYRADSPDVFGQPIDTDIPCNICADLKVRDGKLYWMQTMRSNDLIWGTPYNFMQWMTIQEVVAGWLGLELGKFTLSVSSLHVYDHHYEELAEVQKYQSALDDARLPLPASVMIKGYDEWAQVFCVVERAARALTECKHVRDVAVVFDEFRCSFNLEPKLDGTLNGYFQWIYLLAAEAARRLDPQDEAKQEYYINYAGLYFQTSWNRWRDYVTQTS